VVEYTANDVTLTPAMYDFHAAAAAAADERTTDANYNLTRHARALSP